MDKILELQRKLARDTRIDLAKNDLLVLLMEKHRTAGLDKLDLVLMVALEPEEDTEAKEV